MKRKVAGVLCGLFLAAALAGCAGTDMAETTSGEDGRKRESGAVASGAGTAAKQEVVIAISSEPESGFDPTAGWGHGTTPLIQSTLVAYTQDMQIVKDLATDYEIGEGGLQWRFQLREDAYFTDGEQVQAEDVVFTFQTAMNSQSGLDITAIESCAATGEFEVTFVLKAPTSTFINTVASVGIVPAHAYGEDYGVNPVGSGPWEFVQWNKGEQVILSANEGYYGKVPEIKRVVLIFMDEDAAFAAAQAGHVDVALTSATLGHQTVPGMSLVQVSTLDNRGITLPMTPAQGKQTESGQPIGNDVTSDAAIRQALAYCMDREQIARDALGGFADPAYSENDGMPWNNPEVRIETDVAYARQLLADGGWRDLDGDGIVEKDGTAAAFTCVYPSGDSVRQAVAMSASAQAAQIGIRMEVVGTSWDDISKRMFSDAVLMGWGSSNPYTSYLLYHTENMQQDDYYNPEGFSDPAVDGHLEEALHAGSTEEAYQSWQLAQWDGTTGTAMKGACPWVWLVNVRHLYFVRDGLDIGQQQLHAHGDSWTLLQNLGDWKWQ